MKNFFLVVLSTMLIAFGTTAIACGNQCDVDGYGIEIGGYSGFGGFGGGVFEGEEGYVLVEEFGSGETNTK